VGIWVIVCVQKPFDHILETFRPLRMFKVVFRDSSLNPKQLSLYCLPRAYARGVGVNPPFRLICIKNFITCEKEINCFRILFACYFVDLMQNCSCKYSDIVISVFYSPVLTLSLIFLQL